MDTDEEENFSGEEYVYEEDDYEMGDEEDDEYPSKMSSPSQKISGEKPKVRPSLIVPDGGFVMTDYSAIIPFMDSLISEVGSLLDVGSDTAQMLLQHCKWDREKLLDAFFSDSERMLEDCGMTLFCQEILPGSTVWLINFL